jgi:CHAD domain-containing protein
VSRGPAREDARRDIEHVLGTMQLHLDAIRAREPGVRRGHDAEELHAMRTATRRLRADLRAVREIFEPDEVARLRGELRWLGATLGAARDADVQAEHLRALGDLTPPERALVTRLLQTLERERARARVAVLTTLDGERYARLLRELEARIQHPPLVTEEFSLREIAAVAFARLRRAVEALPAAPSDRALHAVRRAVKRARYAA